MNVYEEDDRRIMVCLCEAVGVRENGDLAPNLTAIAREDRDLDGKVRKMAREVRENAREKRVRHDGGA